MRILVLFCFLFFKNSFSTVDEQDILYTIPVKYIRDVYNIEATWGKQCQNRRYFFKINELKPYMKTRISNKNIVVLPDNSSVTTQDLWSKVLSMWYHIYQYETKYNVFIKVDTDTFVLHENLKYYLQQYDLMLPLYLGHSVEHNSDLLPYASGGMYIITKTSLQKFGKIANSYACPNDHGPEDVKFSNCLRNVQIFPKTILDKFEKETIMILPLQDHLKLNKISSIRLQKHTWYFNKNVQKNYKKNCCSTHPIAFHWLKRWNNFHDLYNYFYLHDESSLQNFHPIVRNYLQNVKLY